MKSGASGESRVAHGGSGRVLGRCLPYDMSAESFEETDTARTPRIRQEAWPKELCWDRMGGRCRRVVVMSRDRVLIMSWFEPLAGITSDHYGSGTAPLVDRGPWRVRWGHEPLVGCWAN
jgi:hypothetical protein